MGELRVTGGILRGRKILVPARGEARYTSSKVRAAIFNLIGDVADYDVLDLFAGSGSLCHRGPEPRSKACRVRREGEAHGGNAQGKLEKAGFR